MNTFSTSFLLRETKGKNEALIYCRITVNKQRAAFSIKKKVRTLIWHKGQAKTSSEEGSSMDAFLKSVEAQLFEHYPE